MTWIVDRNPCSREPLDNPQAVGLPETWVHGTRLGREHTSLRMHLAEDHHVDPGWLECASDGAVHGVHDGKHGHTWAYAVDLPHDLT